jgi:hypothetical protein
MRQIRQSGGPWFSARPRRRALEEPPSKVDGGSRFIHSFGCNVSQVDERLRLRSIAVLPPNVALALQG